MTARCAPLRLAAFQNPEFYRAQAMRLPTYDKPRIVCCASLEARYVALPRGCLDEAIHLLESNGIHVELEDHRERGVEVQARFLGTLRDDQRRAVEALSAHEFGVLAATTAFGKTVIAEALIAERRCSTLVLVHRKELLGQWVERLRQFLSLGRMIRELFMRSRAPYRGFATRSSLYTPIGRRLAAAGISPLGERGPHAFRHARAISLLRSAVPLKLIGDVLGHRSVDSTAVYLKLATEDLRAVALEIPTGVPT